jgi:hypothetical protein
MGPRTRWLATLVACVWSCGPVDRAPPVVERGVVAEDRGSPWREGPRLPQPIANNAVAAMQGANGAHVMTFFGIDSTKAWSGVTGAAYRWDTSGDEGWRSIGPAPGPGRLATTAQMVAGRVFLFGGYTVAEDGGERSLPDVLVYDVLRDGWGFAGDMPIPVDDAVSGVWARSLVYLVSGWHDDRNVADVQVFDPSINLWTTATPIPGAPVFGHAGGVVGDRILYVGGARVVDARPRFVVDSTAWLGRIDASDPSVVAWEPIPPPPGHPMYRAASAIAGGVLLLLGGTDNPYNYDGIGYDGAPSSPVHRLLAYDPRRGWLELPPPPVATMDHRSLGVAGGRVFLVGGMEEGQRVSDRVWHADVEALLAEGVAR